MSNIPTMTAREPKVRIDYEKLPTRCFCINPVNKSTKLGIHLPLSEARKYLVSGNCPETDLRIIDQWAHKLDCERAVGLTVEATLGYPVLFTNQGFRWLTYMVFPKQYCENCPHAFVTVCLDTGRAIVCDALAFSYLFGVPIHSAYKGIPYRPNKTEHHNMLERTISFGDILCYRRYIDAILASENSIRGEFYKLFVSYGS